MARRFSASSTHWVGWTAATVLTVIELAFIRGAASWGGFRQTATSGATSQYEAIAFVEVGSPNDHVLHKEATRSTRLTAPRTRPTRDEAGPDATVPPEADNPVVKPDGLSLKSAVGSRVYPATTMNPSSERLSVCSRGPCLSAVSIGLRSDKPRTPADRAETRARLMLRIRNSPKLAPPGRDLSRHDQVGLYSPPLIIAPGVGIRIRLWGGGPSDARRRRDSAIHAANKVVIMRMKERADSAVRARRDSTARAGSDAESTKDSVSYPPGADHDSLR